MAQAMARINADLARYYNLRKRSCRRVWQARYHSTPLDASHLWRAMAYVERNPVRAHLAACAEEYEWSSARPRSENRADLLDLTPWQAKHDGPRWQEALRSSIDEEAFGQRLRESAVAAVHWVMTSLSKISRSAVDGSCKPDRWDGRKK